MTSKEKAQELFNKFADIEHLGVQGNYNGTWEWSSSLWRQQAKEAALIAVDEIQKVLYSQKTTLSITSYRTIEDFNHDIRYNDSLRHEAIFYFDFVKQEINQL